MKTISHKIKSNLKNMYDVADVSEGFHYWFFKLLGFCLNILEYENLPDSIPSRELELLFILQGYATPFYDKGEPVAIPTNIYDFDRYYTPTTGTFGNPLIPTKRLYFQNHPTKSQNAVLMFNDALHTKIFYIESDGAWLSLINRYARRLADLESSENIYTVKTRVGNAPVNSNSRVRESITNFLNHIRLGKFETITDDNVINCFRTVDFGNTTSENLMSFNTARDKILEQFYRDIGVKFANQKKAQVSDDEIESDEQLLLISLDDVLKERKKGIEEFNKFFGTNASVHLNPKYDRSNFTKNDTDDHNEKGDKEDEI